jgi:hypothetical protein
MPVTLLRDNLHGSLPEPKLGAGAAYRRFYAGGEVELPGHKASDEYQVDIEGTFVFLYVRVDSAFIRRHLLLLLVERGAVLEIHGEHADPAGVRDSAHGHPGFRPVLRQARGATAHALEQLSRRHRLLHQLALRHAS